MEHCDAIQRFFRVHAGFLTAEDPEALAGALQHTEQELLQKLADRERAAARAGRRPAGAAAAGPRGARDRLAGPPSCPPTHRDKVAEWLDMLLESVQRPKA
ncbi:hypothetical protein GCM10023238_03560 [Streptomyces heliomycini]